MFWPLLWAEAKTEGGNLRGCAGPDLLSAARCLFVRPHPLCHGHVLFVRVLPFSCTHSFLHKSIYSALRGSLLPCSQAGGWFLGVHFKEKQRHSVAWPHVLELHEKPLEPFHRNSDEITENPGALLHTKPHAFLGGELPRDWEAQPRCHQPCSRQVWRGHRTPPPGATKRGGSNKDPFCG